MREIRFRAWDKVNKEMVLPSDIPIGDAPRISLELTGSVTATYPDKTIFWDIQNVILMQYTGLKDKNGKESYFDDLVKWGKSVYQIIWNEEKGFAYLKRMSGFEIWDKLEISELKTGEIIGTFHENPELLETERK